MAAAHGGFASAIAFDAQRLYQVPHSLSDTAASILEPATVAVHALRRTSIRLGDLVVVIGGGPIGLLVVQAARISGAGSVILLEPAQTRRQLGSQLGADLCLDPTSEDAQDLIAAHLAGFGANAADVVFECAGIPATIQHSVDHVRRGGVVSLVGVTNHAAEIIPATWLVKEVRLVSRASPTVMKISKFVRRWWPMVDYKQNHYTPVR